MTIAVMGSGSWATALVNMSVKFTDKMVFSAIKGIVPDENNTIGEYFNQRFDLPFDRFTMT